MHTNFPRRTVRLIALIVAAAVATTGLLAAPTISAAQTERVSLLSVQSGHSVLLRTPGLARVAVGDGKIAGVLPIGTEQLVINGKAPGHTTVFVWTGSGRLTYEVTVTAQQADDLASMLRASIDDPGVQVMSFNRSVVVRGIVTDGAQFQVLSDVIGRFEKYAEKQQSVIVNAVRVAHPLGDVQQAIKNLPGAHDIRVDPDGKGNVIVSGHVHDAVTEQAILQRAKGLAGPYLAADGKLIDRISTDTTSQIDIKVYVLEVDNTGLSNLGVALQSGIPDPNNPNNITLGPPQFPIMENGAAGLSGRALNVGAFFRTVRLAPTLNALVQQGHARILSSPDLVTLPNNTATFLVGGEIPYAFSTGLGQVSIAFKNYGVQLEVTPTLTPDGSVETKITPDISDLDFQNAVSINGFFIPALKESKISTDVVTPAGQSIIMGGLLRRIQARTILKIPLLGDLPILGQLFRSTRYQNDQTDVVFVMTPQIINN